ncbi:MAG: ribosomal protein methylthiotransferase accessory factor [Desulfovibrionales bacterium]|nr:ribosomal protein methylthiotransferase accessory factor [Desulfovibrionales bacterium]
MIRFVTCPKSDASPLDKALAPAETVRRAREALDRLGGVLAETVRVDTGRLGIPVFMSVAGPRARKLLPGRKQMGKGSNPEQAEASALMELVERYSFFSLFNNSGRKLASMRWSEAEGRRPDGVIPVQRVLQAVGDEGLSPDTARQVLELVPWRFAEVLDASTGRFLLAPVDLFKALNEYNGASAGNTPEESVLQGACELVERHVSALAERDNQILPTIDPASIGDPVLLRLLEAFDSNGVRLVLKDMSLGLPAPTVAVLAWDPATFPEKSEIVFTAGTAASPVKAAIRAVTEAAQLAGDFETGRVYEPSGLSKPASLEAAAWILEGPLTRIENLPSLSCGDILEELNRLVRGLDELGFRLYALETTDSELGLPAHYNIVPGFSFRERTARGLGPLIGRRLSEEGDPVESLAAMERLAELLGPAPWLDFQQGLLALRLEDVPRAEALFSASWEKQVSAQDKALAVFYLAYAQSLRQRWPEVRKNAARAIGLDPTSQAYFNLRGVSLFQTGEYESAVRDFESALALDAGSAWDLANLGACLHRMGRDDEAVAKLAAALELDPDMEFARRHLEDILG